MLKMNKALMRALDDINSDVNQMPYRTDLEMYGTLEYWNPDAVDAGDCDDYALVKRKRLQAMYPAHKACFRLATCWVEDDDGTPGVGGYHAVLTVHTNKGVYVLDNRYPRASRWRDLPYRWHKMEQPGQVFWVLINQ